ncbi:MAG: DUF3302 domain-containing protein [Alphaproteobacteria bacterium]|nr:DUF3302 domain-containing protein [Alphaproteobacteria bacterium]
MDRGPLEYVALGLIVFVALFLIYAIIFIHDIPYKIAQKRNHPHQEAIHYGGWVSMFTLHAIWPFLWIWATLYDADRGYQFSSESSASNQQMLDKLAALEKRVAAFESGQTDKSSKQSVSGEAPTS